jgi:TonB family protein
VDGQTQGHFTMYREIACAGILLLCVAVPPGATQTGAAEDNFTSLLGNEGESLDGWVIDYPGRDHASASAGEMHIAPSTGLVRTIRILPGFVLRFDVRRLAPGARAFLVLFGQAPTTRLTGAALAVPLLEGSGALPPDLLPDFQLVPVSLNSVGVRSALRSDSDWQSYEAMRYKDVLTVRLNAMVIFEQAVAARMEGWIGFRALDGDISVRNPRYRLASAGSAPREPTLPPGVFRAGEDGASLPRLLHEEKPRYTSAAMAERIQGRVLLECVVGVNGKVEQATVVRSLDKQYGLDEEAIAAAKKWRFEPATRNGIPVPVLITIELTFTLRK